MAREIRDEQEFHQARRMYCRVIWFDHFALVMHWPGRPTAARIQRLLELWFDNGILVAIDL